ncbi:unnamed protein product [Ilex paraguariensis]|uniref:Uncharacterized protein n=1 Tax=Ilex paraguariensis TaxID=185542 RepID=A0ABC8U387_9AQUA
MGILVLALTKLSVSYPNLPHSLCTWTDYTPYRPEVTSAASPLSNLKPMILLANKPFASRPGDLPTAFPKTDNPASIDLIGLGLDDSIESGEGKGTKKECLEKGL